MKYYLNYFLEKAKKYNAHLLFPFWFLIIFLTIIPLFIMFLGSLTSINNAVIIADPTFSYSVLNSIIVVIFTIIFCILLAYPTAYFLVFEIKKKYQAIIFLLLSSPIWSNFLIKLIGIKCVFDLMLGGENMSYGIMYTIIGFTYLYFLFALIPIYNSMKAIPKNIYNASIDIGYNKFETFLKVIIPCTKKALLAAILLIVLPVLTGVGVGKFLDQKNSNILLGDFINDIGKNAMNNDVQSARASTIALFISAVTLVIYLLILSMKFIYKKKCKK